MQTISQILADKTKKFSVKDMGGFLPFKLVDNCGAVYLAFFIESEAQGLADQWNNKNI